MIDLAGSAASPSQPSLFAPAPFVPRRFLTNPHLQTIVGNFLPRKTHLPAATAELVEVSPAAGLPGEPGSQIASQVLCHCHWQPAPRRAAALTVVLVHGLEGSSSSQYIVGNADKLWRAGANVIRMNMRNCGGTEALSPTLYHSGLSSDVDAVLRHFLRHEGLERIALVGYSMGGNLVLKQAGELGADAPSGRAPRALRAVVGVSPAVDLGASATALHRPENRMYERRFLRALVRRFRRKARLFPRAYDAARADGIHSLRDFDDRITALYSGFASAEDYYHRAAAARVVSNIAVPTLILHAQDDPFVHITPETRAALAANPHITLLEPAHGGHCAFLGPARPGHGIGGTPAQDDGYWAETTLLQFLLAQP